MKAWSGSEVEPGHQGLLSQGQKVLYHRQGFLLLKERLPRSLVQQLVKEADRLLQSSRSQGGARNLLHRSVILKTMAVEGLPSKIARRTLGSAAQPTKLTLFNKTPTANWPIRWHQDLTIAVRERSSLPGFYGWSVKDGVHHVKPPVEVLEKVTALRLHLDDTPADNGALRVLPGTHQFGRISREEVARYRKEIPEVYCEVPAGGMMLMSPLLLHASSRAADPRNRRVFHFEYSADRLPGGLRWV